MPFMEAPLAMEELDMNHRYFPADNQVALTRPPGLPSNRAEFLNPAPRPVPILQSLRVRCVCTHRSSHGAWLRTGRAGWMDGLAGAAA